MGSYSSSTGIWTVGSVATGTPETLQIMARVTSPSATTNTATIAHADQFDPDTTNNTASVVVTPQQADLALAKTVSDSTPNVGDTITYTITLSDNGPDTRHECSGDGPAPRGGVVRIGDAQPGDL